MTTSVNAGKPADEAMLANIPRLMTAYYALRPDPSVPAQRVTFGTSGHRGTSSACTFNEAHILATTQAICDYRRAAGYRRPALPRDRHACAVRGRVRLCARGARRERCGSDDRCGRGYTPTPVISHAILAYNRGRDPGSPTASSSRRRTIRPRMAASSTTRPTAGPPTRRSRDGFRIAPTRCSATASRRRRIPFARALRRRRRTLTTIVDAYVKDLAIGRRHGRDPRRRALARRRSARRRRRRVLGTRSPSGTASTITVVSDDVDPTFRFMTLDWDGKIRMDCSSPYAMQRLIALKDRFDVAWACDTGSRSARHRRRAASG